jgi:hypothetical protein
MGKKGSERNLISADKPMIAINKGGERYEFTPMAY